MPTSDPARTSPTPGDAEIERAAALLRGGGVVAFPTETVYGLGAHARDAAAVARVFRLKGRPPTSPLIVHVADAAAARALAAEWTDAAARLAARFWPGPLTLVVPRAPGLPDAVAAGLPTVGLRVPSHPVAQALLRRTALPLAAPSANRFTRLSATCAEHVRAAFGDGVDLVLDAGLTPIGIESTVVSLAGPVARLLRPGAVTLAELRAELGDVETAPPPAPGAAHPAPGMHARHYSPATRLVVLDRGAAAPPGRGAWVRRAPATSGDGDVTLPADAPGFAARLYATLHALDVRGLDWIAVERPPESPEWDAVRDRLRRAAD